MLTITAPYSFQQLLSSSQSLRPTTRLVTKDILEAQRQPNRRNDRPLSHNISNEVGRCEWFLTSSCHPFVRHKIDFSHLVHCNYSEKNKWRHVDKLIRVLGLSPLQRHDKTRRDLSPTFTVTSPPTCLRCRQLLPNLLKTSATSP